MPDYSKGKIYTIRCRTDDKLIYIGCTIEKLSVRFAKHKSGKGCSLYKYVNNPENNTDWSQWYIELYEPYPCDSKDELNKREGEIIRLIGTINHNGYYVDKKEYNKEYRAANYDKVSARQKEYNDTNHDKITTYNKEWYAANREKILTRQQEYNAANPEKKSSQQKKYNTANRDKVLAYQKEYYAANRDKIAAHNKEHYVANRDKIAGRRKELYALKKETKK